ncbi:MAG: SRPBCC domain-containing protein [Reichenbachiella sp.]|uniref:SRPBCC domain-containing protein n=1 Tax=Reichenbachiella sp. TaxID=2184521 RepID=UPI003263B01E
MPRLEKTYFVNAKSSDFYEALTNQTIISQWSGASATMSDEIGSNFSLWGGSIVGINNEVSSNKLVQQWKESSWPEYSKVVFGWRQESNFLVVTLIHEDIPEDSYDDITIGWEEHYMNPLISWLESNNL